MIIGNNVNLSNDTKLGEGVVIGNNVTIYPKVTIGAGTRILDNAVIGRLPISTGNANRHVESSYKSLVIGEGCVIGVSSVLYTGIQVGNHVLIGDLARIREGCRFEDSVVIGGGCFSNVRYGYWKENKGYRWIDTYWKYGNRGGCIYWSWYEQCWS